VIPPAESSDADILVVEDDADIRELIIAQLRREPYNVSAADSIAGVRAVMKHGPVKLIVLDLNLRDGDGVNLCRELRAEGYEGAIIMVTARDTPIDRVLGLELGADDYLTKPFEPRELLARVRNLLKRLPDAGHAHKRNARLARFGPWRLDLHQRRLIAPNDRLVMLSSAEYRLLCRFVDAPDKVLSREMLRSQRGGAAAFDRSIDLQISRLRHKLGAERGGADVILTVRNEGYVMPGPVEFE
jgi:two-component system OmpR family response regulator